MNDVIFWRFFWKEYRAQRGLWLAITATGLMLQFGLFLFVDGSTRWVFVVGIILPAFYALGCAAVLFAAEKEEGTVEFLRSLPTSANRLFAGKLAFGLASTIAMPVLLLANAWITSSASVELRSANELGVIVRYWGIWTFGFFLFGVFYSLLANRVLSALCLTSLTMVLFIIAGQRLPVFGSGMSIMLLLGLVAVADVWLARRWMHEPRIWKVIDQGHIRPGAPLSALVAAWDFEAGGARQMRRLMWQEWCHARGIAALLLVAGIAVCLAPTALSLGIELGLWYLAPALVGICVFRGEQTRYSYRFLADHGLSPAAVWLSKHVVWTTLGTVILAVCVLADGIGGRHFDHLVNDLKGRAVGYESIVLPTLLLATCSVYAVAQLASLLIRNTITATFVTISCLGAVYAWHELLFSIAAPLVFAAALPTGLMLLSFVRVSDWMHERNSLRHWTKVTICGLLASCLTLTALAGYRAYEVPAGGPGFSVDEYLQPSPAAVETAEMYRRAASLFARPDPEDKQEAINLILEATSKSDCAQFELWRAADVRLLRNLPRAQWQIAVSISGLAEEGKLNEAFDRRLAIIRLERHMWAASGPAGYRMAFRDHGVSGGEIGLLQWIFDYGTERQSLLRAIEKLQVANADIPPWDDGLKADYVRMRHVLFDDDSRLWGGMDHTELFLHKLVGLRSPSESARTQRVLDAVTRRRLELVQDCRAALDGGLPMAQWQRQHALSDRDLHTEEPWKWVFTSPNLEDVLEVETTTQVTESLINLEMWRRAMLVRMALMACRLEHGSLPDSLGELVGTYLEDMPLDPWSGEAFRYFPNGFPHEMPLRTGRVLAGQPLILSVGSQDGRVISGKNAQGDTVYRFVEAQTMAGDGSQSQQETDVVSDTGLFQRPVDSPSPPGVCVPFVVP